MKWRNTAAMTVGLLLLASSNVLAGSTIVAFGDSITAGYPYVKVGNGCAGCGGYEIFLQYYLNWEGNGRTVYNYGKSGEYLTFGGLNRVDSVMAAARPDHVLFMEGTNDLGLYVDPATVAYNVYKAAAKVVQYGGKPIVGLLTPDTMHPYKKISTANSYIRSYVGSSPQICLSDQYSALAPYWNSGYSSDGLHPNYYGYWLMGLYWYYALSTCG